MEYTYAELAKYADQGRQMGIFADQVPVPDESSTVDCLLGLTGRDPNWTP